MPADSRGLRLSVLGIVIVSLFVALVGRLWYLEVVNADAVADATSANQVRVVQIPPMRGRIFDRQGRVLADDTSTITVTIDRNFIKKKSVRQAMFLRLAGALHTTPDALEKRYESPKYSPFLPLPLAEDVSETDAVFLKERSEDYPGVEVQEGWKRRYDYAPLASQIIGYIGAIPKDEVKSFLSKGYALNDQVGVAGVEQTYEQYLRGKPGHITYAVDAANHILSVVENVPPTPGDDVQLTIDLKLQQYTEQILQAGIQSARTHQVLGTDSNGKKFETGQTFAAPAGAAVIEDPNTGQVLAMASYPTYDNRWFIGNLPNEKFQQLFPDGPKSPLVDRAVSGRYQIGSTMKPFTTVAALQSGQLPSINDVYDDKGKYAIPDCNGEPAGCTFYNSGDLKPGRIDLPNALAMSSDDYFYRLGVNMWVNTPVGSNVLQNTLHQFGFGQKSGIDVPNEYKGLVPTAAVKKQLANDNVISKDEGAGYFTGDNLQLAIGQGLFASSPLQLVNGYATFANGGNLLTPHVGLAVLAPGTPDLASGQANLAQSKQLSTIAMPRRGTVNVQGDWRDGILRGLEGVIKKSTFPQGTAYQTFLNYNGFPIAGKTGTAQSGDKTAVKDSSLFVGFGPVGPGQSPQYSIGAVIEQGGFGAEGSAPVVKCLFEGVSGTTKVPLAEPQPSDPLNEASTVAGQLPPLDATSRQCVNIVQTGVHD